MKEDYNEIISKTYESTTLDEIETIKIKLESIAKGISLEKSEEDASEEIKNVLKQLRTIIIESGDKYLEFDNLK